MASRRDWQKVASSSSSQAWLADTLARISDYKITKVDDSVAEVEIAPNVRIRVVKATLSDVTGAGTAKPAND